VTLKKIIARMVAQEDLNFLLTNRIPRLLLTRFMGWFSKIEQPLVRDLSIALWRLFSGLDLREAAKQNFVSMHDCFTRELKPGARPLEADPNLLVSPCDAIVGACGRVENGLLIQAKGFAYRLQDLLHEPQLVAAYANGTYATLRLTSAMYHRFHAPHDCTIEQVTYVSGDTWNVNPIALKRIERLYCRNERAVLRTRLAAGGHQITLVPVAAILVASIRLHCADVLLHLKYRGPQHIACDVRVAKGQEMGWFEHGSTIIVFAPPGFERCAAVEAGARLRMGEALMHLPMPALPLAALP